MEEKNTETIKTLNNKQGYIIGIIGAIIGGIIAAIPWVLVYTYGNMIFSLLAAIIAAGEFYGYKLFKGKIDSKLPAIIIILSIIIVSIATLLVIPAILITKEGSTLNIEMFQKIYADSTFSSAILKDWIISVIFTLLGSTIITASIKKQLIQGKTDDVKISLTNTEEITKAQKEAIDIIKPVFVKYDAISKDKAIMKEEILAEIENPGVKFLFNNLKSIGIIKKYKGKYYYNEEIEKNPKLRENKSLRNSWIVFIIVFILVVVISITNNLDNNFNSPQIANSTSNDEVSFKIGNDWESLQEYSDTYGWYYYNYINNTGDVDQLMNSIQNQTAAYTDYPATINIAYDKQTGETASSVASIEELKTNLEDYMSQYIADPNTYTIEQLKSEQKYDMLKIKINYNQEPKVVEYVYYIYNQETKTVGYVTATSYLIEDDNVLDTESSKIANSFYWK